MPMIFSINDFDEISGVLSIVCGLGMFWQDFRLTWTPSNYGDIEEIPVPKEKIWIPNIFLIDPANKMEALGDEDFLGRISYTGTTRWIPAGLIQTLCNVDMYKFPFDTQTCSFTLSPWGYYPNEVRLIPLNGVTVADTTYYSPNAQWTLQKALMKRAVLEHFDNLIEIRLILKRKSLYFIINMLAPILLLSLLNPLVFALPVESGERVSYAITIFLSFAVFMTLLSDNIPKSSEPMSLMSYFLIITMSMSTLISVLAVVTMRFHFRDPTFHVSSKSVFVLNVLRLRFLHDICGKRKKKAKVADKSAELDVSFEKKYIAPNEDEQDTEAEKKVTWKILAEGYDRVMMHYFYIFVFFQWFILVITLT
ncbi:neuronal acetylcholine receptor subunit alpha-3-like [Saccostrea cucullata]|uniref:neuronal acetylcholine receptor subunit alpha-3-like n=1 Tax=Saccostrea cuccullata TaxID=36930 RepID=UPI002ED4BBB3